MASEAWSDKVIASGLSYGGIRAHVWAQVNNTTGNKAQVQAYGELQDIKCAKYSVYTSLFINGTKMTSASGSTNNYDDSWATRLNTGFQYLELSRGHSDYTVEVYSYVSFTTTNWSTTASVLVTIPAAEHHTVKFNANGGSGAPGNQTKWYGEILTLSKDVPTRSGFTFKGWATSSSSTTVAYAAGAQYGQDADITLYAVWQSNDKMTINFDANGGSGAPSSITHSKYTTTTLPSTMPTLSGSYFLGWSTSKNGKVEYGVGWFYTNDSFSDGSSITLYAVWATGASDIKFFVPDGSTFSDIKVKVPEGAFVDFRFRVS